MGCGKKRGKRGTGFNGLHRERVNVRIVATMEPKEQIAEEVSPKDWQRVARP